MKEMLFHDCARYAHLVDITEYPELQNTYGNRFVALYDIIVKLNLVNEFIAYQINCNDQIKKEC